MAEEGGYLVFLYYAANIVHIPPQLWARYGPFWTLCQVSKYSIWMLAITGDTEDPNAALGVVGRIFPGRTRHTVVKS